MSFAVRARGLGKEYRLGTMSGRGHAGAAYHYKSLRETLAKSVRAGLRAGRNGPGRGSRETFWALKDVSFDVREGEVVGLIGRNGAGKSTLLRLLSRITEPTQGYADLRGRVGSLLEIGTGFHPELTGRENVYLNGAILGMKVAEITRKFDEIVAFADIERFLDTPVKRYSSGMYVRLAFAVAAHLEPEVLVVDEVLAVGDASFQKKCLGKMSDIGRQGRTVLFVSHNMQAIRQLCERAILLDGGRVVESGPSAEVIDRYLASVAACETLEALPRAIAALPDDPAFRLEAVRVRQDGRDRTEVVSGKPVVVEVDYEILQDTVGFQLSLELRDAEGVLLFESLHNGDEPEIPRTPAGRYSSTATLPADLLAPTLYELSIVASIHGVRRCMPGPIAVALDVTGLGRVNRAYPGYRTPGKLAPLIDWRTGPGEGP